MEKRGMECKGVDCWLVQSDEGSSMGSCPNGSQVCPGFRL